MMHDEAMDKITQVQAKYANELMAKAHVVGVGIGLKKTAGVYTQIPALVVMVDQKIPREDLAPEDLIPAELDGVPVDVQETGAFTAQQDDLQ